MLGAAAVIAGTTLMLTGCLGGGGGEAENGGGDSGETVIRIASAETAEASMDVLREAAT